MRFRKEFEMATVKCTNCGAKCGTEWPTTGPTYACAGEPGGYELNEDAVEDQAGNPFCTKSCLEDYYDYQQELAGEYDVDETFDELDEID